MTLQLRLVAWLNHQKLTLATRRPVTIVAGDNAAGKTALLYGLEFCLLGTGKLQGIPTKKDLAHLTIADDARETVVGLQIPDLQLDVGRKMDRGGKQAVNVGDTSYEVTKGDAKIWTRLGCEPAQVRAALEADHLLAGDEAERRRVLFAAAGAKATVKDVSLALTQTELADTDRRRLAKQAVEEGFLAAQKTAEAERATRTRRLRENVSGEPDPIFRPPWIAEETRTEIRLDELRLDELIEREQGLEQSVNEAEHEAGVSKGKLEADLSRARSDRQALIDEGEAVTREIEELEGAEAAYTEAATAAETLIGEVERTSRWVTTLEAELRAITEGMIEKPEVCPAIPGGPACPMTAKRLDAHREKTMTRRLELEQQVSELREQLPGLRARQADANAGLAACRQDVERKGRAEARLPEIHAELDTAEAQIGELTAALAKAVDQPDGPSKAEELRERLANLRKLIAAKGDYDRRHEAAIRDALRRESLTAEQSAWDAAAKALAPGGIPLQLFTARIPALQSYLDEFGVAPIRLTPYAELEAEVEGRWRTRAQLSESWRLRLSMAASHLVARAAGFPLLVLDRFGHLDRIGRVAVLEGARRVAPLYPGGVLILATLQRAKPEPTGLPDVETLWLTGGALVDVG